MRNHGWELPYHPLQTVAVAVFAGLAFSFYVFFIPFVGNRILKFHIYAVFSPVVLAVVILYVRCAACDPADPGVHRLRQQAASQSKKVAVSKGKPAKEFTSSDTGVEQLQDESDRSLPSTFPLKSEETNAVRGVCSYLGVCLHHLVCKKQQQSEKVNAGEQLLYCSICDAEISKNSKHCRACDKCVQGFDHHCRWLNNCVGKKNYTIFVALMVSCLLLLVIVWATGILVLVRCFSHREIFDKDIAACLGSSFSRVPYITVVVSLTLLALSATVPLTQLFFFHVILIHKGLTTYDYILAIRDQGRGFGEGDGLNSMMSSPASSTVTGVSGYSSSGALALQQGVFCTPPRMFVEHQQTVLPYSIDLEASGGKPAKQGAGTVEEQKKIPVGINPWKLARISTDEALRAAARARESSSIVWPTRDAPGSLHVTETEESGVDSSHSASGEITVVGGRQVRRKHDVSYPSGKERWLMLEERRDKNMISSRTAGPPFGHRISQKPRSPLAVRHKQMLFKCSPSRFSGEFRPYSGGTYAGSSYSGSHMASPDVFPDSPDLQSLPQVLLAKSLAPNCGLGKVLLERSRSDGYEASMGDSGDENGEQCQQPSQEWNDANLMTSSISATEKVATWEESLEDDLMPRGSLGSRSLGSKGSRSSKAESSGGGSRAEANILKHVKKEWQELSDGLSVSSNNSNSSSPTCYNSPLRNSSDFQVTGDSSSQYKTPDENQAVSVYDGPSTSLPSKAMSGTKSLLSTQRLMDSILRFKRALPSSKSNNALFEPTA